MNEQIVQALKKIRSKKGESVLSNERQFRSVAHDVLPGDQLEAVRDWLVVAIKLDAYIRLKQASAKGDLRLEASHLADILHTKKKADAAFAKEIISILAMLFSDEPVFLDVVQPEKTIIEEERGNTPGNIVDGGFAAIKGEWVY